MHTVKITYADSSVLEVRSAKEMDIKIWDNYIQFFSEEGETIEAGSDIVPSGGDVVVPLYNVARVIDYGFNS